MAVRGIRLSAVIGTAFVLGLMGYGAIRTRDFLDIPSSENLDRLVADYRKAGLPWTASDLNPPQDLADEDNAEPLLQAASLGVPWDDVIRDRSASEYDLLDDHSAVTRRIAYFRRTVTKNSKGGMAKVESKVSLGGVGKGTTKYVDLNLPPALNRSETEFEKYCGVKNESSIITHSQNDSNISMETTDIFIIPNKWQKVSKDGTRDTTLAHQILDPIQPAFKAAIRASKCKVLDYHHVWDLGPAIMFPEFSNTKQLISGLVFDAELKTLDGLLDQATDEYAAALKIADFTRQEPIMIAGLVACSMDDIVYRSIERAASYVQSNAHALEKLSALCDRTNRTNVIAQALKGETYLSLVVARNPAYRSLTPTSPQSLAPVLGSTMASPNGIPNDPLGKSLIVADLRFATDAMKVATASLDDPLAATLAIDNLQLSLSRKPTYGAAFQSAMESLWTNFGWSLQRTEARRVAVRCLLRALMLRSQGKVVRSIKDVPGIWTDPFTKTPLLLQVEYDEGVVGKGIQVLSPRSEFVPNPQYSNVASDNKSQQGPVVASYPPQPFEGQTGSGSPVRLLAHTDPLFSEFKPRNNPSHAPTSPASQDSHFGRRLSGP